MSLPFKPLERLQLKRDYKETFGTEHGKRVLAHILKVAGLTRPRFDTNIEQTRINEGERRLAMSIYRFVHSSEDELLNQLAEEITKKEKEHDNAD